MNEKILTVLNRHVDDCGTPPSFSDELLNKKYVSYFQNHYGEQWVFLGDGKDGGVLYGGEVDWEGLPVTLKKPYPATLLNAEEQVWLISCLMVSTGEGFEKIRGNMEKQIKREIRK
jgi:hypothetical protein